MLEKIQPHAQQRTQKYRNTHYGPEKIQVGPPGFEPGTTRA